MNTKLVHSSLLRLRQRYIGAYFQCKTSDPTTHILRKQTKDSSEEVYGHTPWMYSISSVNSWSNCIKLSELGPREWHSRLLLLFFKNRKILSDKGEWEESYHVERSAWWNQVCLGKTETSLGDKGWENSLREVMKNNITLSCFRGEREID